MDDLDVIDPAGTTVGYLGERLEIKPLTIGMVPKVVRAGRPVIDALFALVGSPDPSWVDRMVDATKGPFGDLVPPSQPPSGYVPPQINDDMVTTLLDLVDKHGDSVFEMASICTGKPAEWLQDGPIDEFVELAQKIFAVNRDFFRQKLAPLLAGRAKQNVGVGLTPSS